VDIPDRYVESVSSRADCVECDSAGSVERGLCQVCYAEPGEGRPVAAVLPPAVLVTTGRAGDLRFADVLEELGAIVSLAASVEDGDMLAAACRRAERLLNSLREQFHADLGLPEPALVRSR
jgi:hypothetical protein